MLSIYVIISIFITYYKFYSTADNVFYKGTCPNLKVVENFNLTAYCQGTWYEVARYANEMENRGECVHSEMSFQNNNCKMDSMEKVDGKDFVLEAQISLAPKASGFIAHSPNVTIIEANFPVLVPAVDYDSYAFLYRCAYNETTKTHHDYLWVQSRSKKLEGVLKAKVDEAIKAIGYLDTTKFVWTHFSDEYCKSKT